jgi:hypothetical protein
MHIPIVWSLVEPDCGLNPQTMYTALEANTLTISPLFQLGDLEYFSRRIVTHNKDYLSHVHLGGVSE